jgi:ComF family protein
MSLQPLSWIDRQVASILHLIFPLLCPGCRKELLEGEAVLCTQCKFRLPRTYYHLNPENRTAKLFWGRAHLTHASSFLYFRKGALVQKCMFLLKYKNRPDIGHAFGQWYGFDLKESGFFPNPGFVIPVPLHPTRLAERGYNQAEAIAEGLAEALGWTCRNDILYRRKATASQTGKNRYERWKNVGAAFALDQASQLVNRHVILVDDVVTTGATIEACARALQDSEIESLSVLTIAIAD